MTSRHCRSYDTYSPRLQCNSRVTRLPLEPKSSFHPIFCLLLLAIRRKTLTSPSYFSFSFRARPATPGCLSPAACWRSPWSNLISADFRVEIGSVPGQDPISLSLSFFFLLAPLALSLRRVTLRVSGLAAASSVSATASLPHHTPTHTLCPSLSPRLDDQSQSSNPAAEIQIGPAGLPPLPPAPFSRTQTTRPDCYKHHPAQSFKEGTERKSPSTSFRPPILSTPSSSVGALSPLPSPSLSLLYSDPNSQPFDRGHSFFSFIIIPNLYSRGSRRI